MKKIVLLSHCLIALLIVRASTQTLEELPKPQEYSLEKIEASAVAVTETPVSNDPDTPSIPSNDAPSNLTPKLVMDTYEKALMELIIQQRNPNVADLTINDAVQIALRQNPDILNAIQQIRLTHGQLVTVAATAMPKLGVNSAFTEISSELNVAKRLNNSKTAVNESWYVTFGISQKVFDGGASYYGIKAGNIIYETAFFALRAQIDATIAQVITAFYQVVLNRTLIVAQQQNVAAYQAQVDDQRKRYDAGTVPQFNVLQAEVQLANAMPPLIQAENDYRVSLYNLVRLLGMDYPAGSPAEVPFNIVGSLGYTPREINVDESIRAAVTRNPVLKAQRMNIVTQAAVVSGNYSGFMPTFNLSFSQQNQNSGDSRLKQMSGVVFGVTGSWNIFDGGATIGNIAQEKARLLQTKNSYDDAVRSVVLNVQQSISNLRQAKETIDSQTASVVMAAEALRLARDRLNAGAGTQLDVINAQVQLLLAQTNVLSARYAYIAAMAAYDQALSLDTQYVETFDDPLTSRSPQSLKKSEAEHFKKVTDNARPLSELPKQFRNSDLARDIVGDSATDRKAANKKRQKEKAEPSKKAETAEPKPAKKPSFPPLFKKDNSTKENQ